MNAALYIRVSTDYQTELSPDSQKSLLLEYAKKNGLIVRDEHIFIEDGISGKKVSKRPEFLNMIALAKSKERPFQKILVWKFSRFARNQEESIVYKNMLKKDGIDVISISEPIIDGPFGSLIERIIEWMDEYYSINLSGEVMRGMKEKAMRGGVQSCPVLGYDIVDNKYVLNEEEAEIVRKAFKMTIEGDTTGLIARYFNAIGWKNKRGNLFTGRVVRYMIQNPVYYGMVRWNYSTKKSGNRKLNPEEEWIIVKGEHDPIVSEEVWKEANGKLYVAKPSKRPVTKEYKHWLGGLLRCSSCGATLTYNLAINKRNGKEYKCENFRCNNYVKRKCDSANSISIPKIEKEVINLLTETRDVLNRPGPIEFINVRRRDDNDDTTIIKKQLENLSKKLIRINDAYLNEVYTLEEYKENKSKIEAEKNMLLDKLNKCDSDEEVKDKLIECCKTALELIQDPNSTIEQINNFLKSFIDSIVFNRARGTLILNLYVN